VTDRLNKTLALLNRATSEGEALAAWRAARRIKPDGELFVSPSTQSTMSNEDIGRIARHINYLNTLLSMEKRTVILERRKARQARERGVVMAIVAFAIGMIFGWHAAVLAISS